MRANSAGKTVTGRRKSNQDAFFEEERWGLFVVADGMGGYEGGEVASSTAIAAIREFFRANEEDDGVTWPFGLRRELSLDKNMVRVAVLAAHHAVVALRKGDLGKMGTTVCVLALRENRAILAHVGDSRIYRVRGREVEQLTRDHSLYNELKEAGAVDLVPENEFPYRNIVTRALGFSTSSGEEPTLHADAPRPGDIYLLCTDGLYEKLDGATIGRVIEESSSLQQACDVLVQIAYERGSTDNITALLVRIDDDVR